MLRFVHVVSLCSALVLIGAGCSSRLSSDRPPALDSLRQPADSMLDTSASACSHPYYPLRQGYTAVFKDSYTSLVDGSPQTERYTWKAIEVGPTSAKLELQFQTSGLRSTQEINCVDRQLRTNAYVNFAGGQSVRAKTVSVTGEYLPRDLAVGSRWQQRFTVLIQPQGSSRQGLPEMRATVEIEREAVREEAVTVPAGNYTALVIKTMTNTRVSAGESGAVAEIPSIQVEGTEWWVRGVGQVKVQTRLVGGSLASAEAERIVIP